VLRFYANLKDLGLAGRMTARDPAEPVPPDDLRHLMRLIEEACQSALPLLDKDDTERKAKIEAMGALKAAERSAS
jgi:hypothetical protein